MANYVDFTALDGATVSINPEEVASLQPVPASLLPTGVVAGTYVQSEDGSRVAVQGTVVATVTALGVASGSFGQNQQYIETSGTISTAAGPIVVQTMTTPVVPPGTYLVSYYGEVICTNAGDDAALVLAVNGNTAAAARFNFASTDERLQFTGFRRFTIAVAAAFLLELTMENIGGAGDVTAARRILQFYRIS